MMNMLLVGLRPRQLGQGPKVVTECSTRGVPQCKQVSSSLGGQIRHAKPGMKNGATFPYAGTGTSACVVESTQH